MHFALEFIVLVSTILTIVHSHPVLQNDGEILVQQPVSQTSYRLIKRRINDADLKRFTRDISCDDSDEDSDCGDDLEFSEAKYRYDPYLRIKRISHHPLSNYADSYDKFPTVA